MILLSFALLGRERGIVFWFKLYETYLCVLSFPNVRRLQVEQMLEMTIYNHPHALLSPSPLLGCLDCTYEFPVAETC